MSRSNSRSSGRYCSNSIYRRYSQNSLDKENSADAKHGIDIDKVHGSYKGQLFDRRWLKKAGFNIETG